MNYGKSEGSPRPRDHFSLICGVGSGGLVAILFGILGMRCDEAMDAYVRLGQLVFKEEVVDGRIAVTPREPNRSRFKEELERLVEKYLGDKDATIKRALGSCPVSCLNHV